ncbi:hypothetical protein SAPIO_CDS9937 [Scedosporium apiospermum]|uniref:Thioredoxin domain-containing protein n=1 Tax=Pseudallescheria apiosperma TaxID=563466 RepID=A0A084FW03_PSEDA|nr:uncharacterized protein SAPIO_CDS9937 [Scedosporium apiospermum]KEZ39265.1 hypothetical protein SAPIO_CDS9937 [Scedosporium apiospermum]
MPELKAGDAFPEGVTFSYIPYTPEISDVTVCGRPQNYDVSKNLADKKVVIVAIPGAFTPTCSSAHLPSYIANIDKLKAKGVDHVIFIAHNDAFVMSGWGKVNGVKDDSILFMSDPNVAFSSQIGWAGPERANRYAIVVDHGKVIYAAKEVDPGIALTGAEAVLARL